MPRHVLCGLFVFAAGVPALGAPVVRLHLAVENGSLEALSRLDLDEAARSTPWEEGMWGWRVLDSAARPLARGGFPDPTIASYDAVDGSGALSGGTITLDSAHFLLKVNSPPGAAAVEIRDAARAIVGVVDLGTVPPAGGAEAAAWSVEEIWHSGPSGQRLDIVFVGDGYTAAESATHRAHAQAAVDYFAATPPYSSYMGFVNAWVVYVVSAESGADEPDANPAIFRNTALDASYNWGGTARCLYASSAKVTAAAACAPAVDEILVPVNHSRYGGCGGAFGVYAAGNSAALEVAIHEFGHSFTGLADEYDYGDGAVYSGPEFGAVNSTKYGRATLLSQQRKWWYWVGAPGFGIDVYEGSSYHQFGAYRPHANCKMRSLGPDFCAVCAENKIKGLYVLCPPIQGSSPSSNPTVPAGGSIALSVTMPSAPTLSASFSVDGVPQPGGELGDFTYVASRYPSGTHSVVATAADSTDRVKRDPTSLLSASRSWQVQSTGGLSISSIVPDHAPQRGGDRITISGLGLALATEVRFGTLDGLDLERRPDGTVAITTPPSGASGPVDVTVVTAGGTVSRSGGFTFDPTPVTLVYTGGSPRAGGFLAYEVTGPPNSIVALVIGTEEGSYVAKGIETCIAGPRSDDFEVAIHPLRDRLRTDATGVALLVVPLDDDQWRQRFVNVYATAAVKGPTGWRGSNCAIATVFP